MGIFLLLLILKITKMRRRLKLILLLMFFVLSGKIYSQSKVISTTKKPTNKIDSLIINTIINYKNQIVKSDRNSLITLSIREITKDNANITISYILNDFDLNYFKASYVFYINNETSVLVEADTTEIKNYNGEITFIKITPDLAEKVKGCLNDSQKGFYTYSPIYWIILYHDGKTKIIKDLLILPPGF